MYICYVRYNIKFFYGNIYLLQILQIPNIAYLSSISLMHYYFVLAMTSTPNKCGSSSSNFASVLPRRSPNKGVKKLDVGKLKFIINHRFTWNKVACS